MSFITGVISLIEFILINFKHKLTIKLAKKFISYLFFIFIVVSVLLVLIMYPYMEIRINYDSSEKTTNYYDNYEENVVIRYDDINGYKIKKRDVEYMQERLDSGYINYNDQKTKFIPIDNRGNCGFIESGGIIHYAAADNKVLYKHKNCIPKNQHVMDMEKK